MDTAVLTGLISSVAGLVGVALGAGLNLFFSRSNERTRHERELRATAYLAYLSSVGEMETAVGSRDAAKLAEAQARAIAAKVRICAHGSKEVVTALAIFEGDPVPGLTAAKKTALLTFLSALRKDLNSPGEVGDADIEKILFRQTTA
jgi:hypothetical protein